MDLPRNSGGLDDDVIIAWADASARLAAELRRAQGVTPRRPQLCLVEAPCYRTAAAVAVIYYPYAKLFHCACQWNLAFEVHPLFRGLHWLVVVAISLIWQAYDRLKPVSRGDPGVGSPCPFRRKVARVVLHHGRRPPPGDTHPVLDAAAGV